MRPGCDENATIAPQENKIQEQTDFLAPAQAADELGRLGPYRVLKVLGAGGMGVVFRAEDPQLQRIVALKAMLPTLAVGGSARQRFLREARAAAAIKHDHIVTIHQVGEDRGVPFLAMEVLEGQPLDERLQRETKLPIEEVVRIGREIAEGLQAAHERGLIHRDIKPANLWLEGKRGRVKILDFGLARAADEQEQLTQQGAIVGTPAYMAPEQARGNAMDARCDLFSLGVVLYRLCSGQAPFKGTDMVSTLMEVATHDPPPPARINPATPVSLSDLVMQLLEKDPARRPASAAEVVAALQTLQADFARPKEDLQKSPASASPRSSRLEETSAPGRGEISAEPFSLEQLKSSDVVLNYAAIDDYPLQEGKPGWVSQLHRNLEVRMEQLSGEKVHIARLPEDAISPVIETEVLEQVPQAKAMISVVSPPFLNSQLCRREVEQFWHGADQTGGRYIKEKSRLLKVLKTAVSEQQMPRPLLDIFSPLFGFEFFELDAETGRVREFDATFGPVLKQRFFERVYDLAFDGCQVLSLLKQVRSRDISAAAPDPNRRWVYLATTTSDIADERDRVKRELLERGHVVLPDAPLPMLSRDVETMVPDCLAKCTIAIHLLGQRYGVTPEDSSESIPALQVRLTADPACRPDLQRLIWMPGGGESADERQRAFVRRVQEDPALHRRAEIIEGNLNLLKKDLIRRLAPPEEKPNAVASAKASDGTPKLYLICDPRDETAVEAPEDYLFTQGLEVMLPAFDGDDAAAAALHQDNLLTCDAVLVYYGAAPRAWVDIKLRELLKASGYGRQAPIAVQAVYIAPPDDRRKDRFHSHRASVIRQPGEFQPCAELNTFVSQIREVCA
jgi:serine/threonine protein kinase